MFFLAAVVNGVDVIVHSVGVVGLLGLIMLIFIIFGGMTHTPRKKPNNR